MKRQKKRENVMKKMKRQKQQDEKIKRRRSEKWNK